MFGSYIVLTEPVPDLLAAIGWTGGEAIVDARMFLHYFRTTNDGRVLMGSGSGPIGRGNRIDRRFTHDAATAGRAELGLRRLLPGLASARVERAWGGPIDVSADHLPFVGTAPAGASTTPPATRGTASARRGSPARRSPRSPRARRRVRPPPAGQPPGARVPPEPIRFLGGAAIRAAILACEEAEEAGRRAPLLGRAVGALPRLLGLGLGTR